MARPLADTEHTAPDRDVVPLYHRVYVVLLQKLSDASFPPNQALPSEDDLAQSFGVSRVTIRKAMDRLEREGRILRQRGRGTFPQTPERPHAGSKLFDNHMLLAQKTTVALLEYGLVRPPATIARSFAISEDAELLRIARIRRDARSPISHTICYVALDLVNLVPRSAIGSLPISTMLAASGVALDRFEERITATLADADTAALLDVDVGTPLISMTRHVRGANGRMLEILQARYRPDRYEYRVEYPLQDAGTPWKAMITDSTA